jgi:serine/threonine protein kinase
MNEPGLDGQRWLRIKQLFADAATRPPAERGRFLTDACRGDEGLRREVESLLASYDEADDFFERRRPAVRGLADAGVPLTPAIANLTAGRRLGPYEIVAKLGAGGMGVVYRARDARLNRTVAIKVLPTVVTVDSDARHRFEREARAVAALNHPHICTLHDVGHESDLDFLVMEHLEGETLAARLEKGPLAIDLALQYAIQIASALDRAHRAGIVHRDLKPANIFLVRTGGATAAPTAKLLDFGLAKAARTAVAGAAAMTESEDLTAPGFIVGTVRYMAPEQIESRHVDARTDIFAFGLVLFEMLTGRKPFEGHSPASAMAAILEREAPRVSSLQPLAPAALDRVVSTCLAKDPDDRWQTARDLLRELQWTHDRDARADPAKGDTRRPRRRSLSAASTIAALAAVGAASYFAGARTSPERVTAVRVDRLTDFPGLEEHPALSPDGRSVAFDADEGGTRQIWVRLIAGGAPFQLTRDSTEHTRPRWSPDSSSLIYFSPPAGAEPSGTLWEVSALGGAPRRIVDSLADGDISHDGASLAFIRSVDGRLELGVLLGGSAPAGGVESSDRWRRADPGPGGHGDTSGNQSRRFNLVLAGRTPRGFRSGRLRNSHGES